jgi:hypothetical protein
VWERIAAHPEVSPGFRQIARDNAAAVGALAPQLDRLPG